MIGQSTPEPAPEQAPVPSQEPAAGTSGARETREIGGRAGPDPTRYGDWEKNGRCIDF
ncbi:MAG: DUF1674 domain-containing protein [Lysobacter sp.]|nr:DUF1674 domain-containing protein [Lysobacter sp.]